MDPRDEGRFAKAESGRSLGTGRARVGLVGYVTAESSGEWENYAFSNDK